MKKEHVLRSDNCADLLQSLNSATRVLDWNEINNPTNWSSTTVRILKNRYSGETGVACQLSYDLPTCKFYETQPEPEFNAATDF